MIRPIVLLIVDGWGISAPSPTNAISIAKTPNINHLFSTCPHTTLKAAGEAVGLPRDEVGNTETGHLNIGAGRIVYQDLPRINMAIADGSFYTNTAFIESIEHSKKNSSNIHIMGLIGAGGVHANNEHLFALLFLMREHKLNNVYLHLFTDGRDSPPTSGLSYVKKVDEELKRIGVGVIVSIAGRYYAMDRDSRWDRIAEMYKAITTGQCPTFLSAEDLIANSYQKGITDEFIKPAIIVHPGQPPALIKDNDSILFYNYRIDRPRELTKAFVFENLDYEINKSTHSPAKPSGTKLFSFFTKQKPLSWRSKKLNNLYFVTMTEYEKSLPVHVAFPPQQVRNPLGQVISDQGLRQIRIAESEKERFVTFYFNGQREMPYIGEDRIIIPSAKIATYDKAPEMKANEITQSVIEHLKQNVYDVYIVNFANADMVGHTGILQAAVSACEMIDNCIGKIMQAVDQTNGLLAITADHGNAETMVDTETNEPHTEHTANQVPFILYSKNFAGKPRELPQGLLADIAPTLLQLMQIPIPVEMNGRDLLEIHE